MPSETQQLEFLIYMQMRGNKLKEEKKIPCEEALLGKISQP